MRLLKLLLRILERLDQGPRAHLGRPRPRSARKRTGGRPGLHLRSNKGRDTELTHSSRPVEQLKPNGRRTNRESSRRFGRLMLR